MVSGRIAIEPLRALEPAPARRGFRLAPPDGIGTADSGAIFDVPAAQLWQAWLTVAARQPRTRLIALDADRHRSVHVQHSRLFRFRDRVRAEIVKLGHNRCCLTLDSRALLGYYDLGVNRCRVLTWVAELQQELHGPA